MAPVRNAMCFVDHQHGNVCRDACQDFGAEMLVGQAFWRNQQNVGVAVDKACLDLRPIVPVIGIDGGRTHAHALCGSNLIAHQRQQR